MRPKVSFTVLAGVTLALMAPAVSAFVVEDIELYGLQRLEAATVFTHLPVETGEEFDPARTSELVRTLFKTQLFSDVQVSRRDNVLVITVVERPAITEITYEGLEIIDDETLEQVLEEAGIATGRIFNKPLLERLHNEILQQYHAVGHYNAEVATDVVEREDNRVAIEIKVAEGEPAEIEQVHIIGNVSYPEDRLLDLFQSGPPQWYDIMGNSGRYSKLQLSGDLERLRAFYLNRGFMKFQVDSAQIALSPTRDGIFITVHINEGPRFVVREVSISGVFIIDQRELIDLLQVRAGEFFSSAKAQASSSAITTRLAEEGYSFAKVNPVTELDEESAETIINFFVDPGQRVYVRRIDISGNRTTQDEVLRRELRQLEGSWLSTPQLERSRYRIQRLPYIESVEIEQFRVAGTSDQVDIMITVTERLAGNFSAGLGFSSGTGLTLAAGVEQENFLGTGNRVGVHFDNSETSTRYSFDFYNPYYTINGVSRGFGVSTRSTDTADDNNRSRYESRDFLAYLSYGIPIADDSTFSFSGRAQRINFDVGADASLRVQSFLNDTGGNCVADRFFGLNRMEFDNLIEGEDELPLQILPERILNPPSDGAEAPANELPLDNTDREFTEEERQRAYEFYTDTRQYRGCEASYNNLILSGAFTYDTRDRSLFTRKGSLRQISVTGSVPGSGLEYYTLRYKQEEYIDLTEDYSLSMRVDFAYGDGYAGTPDLPFANKFVTGGPKSVRGYKVNTLGPRDEYNRPFGGNLMVNTSAAVTFPIPLIDEANLRGSLFFDAGYAFEEADDFELGDIRAAVGLGVSWLSPLGGVSMNISLPINDQSIDETESFQFNLGNL